MATTPHYPPTLWHTGFLSPVQPRHPDLLRALIDQIGRLRSSTHGLSDVVLQTEREAAGWVLEGLYQAYFCQPRAVLALPLSKRFYIPTHPTPIRFPLGTIQRILEAAISLGWVDVRIGECRAEFGRVTTVSAAGDLASRFAGEYQEWRPLSAPPESSLVLVADATAEKTRRCATVEDNPSVAQWQRNLHTLNELFLSHCIFLDAPNEVILEAGAAQHIAAGGDGRGRSPINVSQVTLCRIFARGRFDCGGRFYGGWWQFIPSRYRRYLAIDGHMTVEADFSGMALNCLYAHTGRDIGMEDPYDIGLAYESANDPRRKIVKKYINAILNDEKGTYRLSYHEQRLLGLSRKELRSRVESRHQAVAQHFHTEIGLHLQFLESEIAERVMLGFADQGQVCLPIHDSFLVSANLSNALVDAMAGEFQRSFGRQINITLDDVFAGERMGLPDPSHLPQGLTSEEQAEVLHALHWGRHSMSANYHASWVMQTQSLDTINADYESACAKWAELRPHIQKLTQDVVLP